MDFETKAAMEYRIERKVGGRREFASATIKLFFRVRGRMDKCLMANQIHEGLVDHDLLNFGFKVSENKVKMFLLEQIQIKCNKSVANLKLD